jgi:hypothetical protein
MLLSWAAKLGWKPTYVDLDIGQGSITIPGCISATPIEKPIDIIDGIPLEMPLVYFYGHPNPRYLSTLFFGSRYYLVLSALTLFFCLLLWHLNCRLCYQQY